MRLRLHLLWFGGLIAVAGVVIFAFASDRRERTGIAAALARGDADRGPNLMRRYGCAGCHTIAGVQGADGKVGPPLVDLRARVYVGGGHRNTADNLTRFIVAPNEIVPDSAMPKTGISEQEARDVVTYLYAQ
jgi:cytochrome c